MASFDSVGGGFSRGFSTGTQLRLAKNQQGLQREELAQQEAARIAKQFEESQKRMEEQQKTFRTIGIEMLKRGVDPESPKFQQLTKAQQASVMAHANAVAGLGFEDQAKQLVQEQSALFEASITGVKPENEQFETIDGSEVSPDLAGAVIQRNTNTNELKILFDPDSDASSLEQRINALEASGLPKQIAQGIAAGRFSITVDPVTREAQVIDIGTGELVFQHKTTTPEQTEKTPIIPKDVKTSEAVGAQGFVSNAANVLRDAIGLGLQNPKAQEATDALNTVQQTTRLLLQAEVPGRPAVDVREGLSKLTVTPNSLLQGEERAKSRLEQTRQFIKSNLEEKQAMLAGKMKPEDRAKLIPNVIGLEQMLDAYDTLIEGFEEDEEDPELQKLLEKYAPEDDRGGN